MRTTCFLILIILGLKGNAQIKSYSIHQADSLIYHSDKNLVIFISASWCKVCNLMKESCLRDDEIVALFNESVNFIDFNSELKDSIQINGRYFQYIANGSSGKNELALELGTINKKFSLPTTVILNNSAEIIFQKAGLIQVSEMKKILMSIN